MNKMIKYLIVALMFIGTSLAGDLNTVYPCQNPAQQGCSNDPVPSGWLGILGDGTLGFTYTDDPTGPVEGFEIWSNQDSTKACLIVGPTVRTVKIDATDCIKKSCTDWNNPICAGPIKLKIRAFNHKEKNNPNSQIQYGGFSNEVEFLPHICLVGTPTCETQCYAGAPYYLPERSRCPAGLKSLKILKRLKK